MKITMWRIKPIEKPLLVAFSILVITATQCAARDALDFVKILDGYSLTRGSAVDAVIWTIERKGGLTIHFEAGSSEGIWADPKDADTYSWTRTQTVNGCKVLFALVKPGLKTRWEPKNGRNLPPGNVLLVTFLLGGEQSFHTANFSAKIASDQELADALLMIMTFDPSKGSS
jgi:hypothetical protein